MALSYVQYYGDGSNRNFSLVFSYLSRDNISATVDGNSTTFSWLNSTTIQLPTPPANGAVVEIRRTTNRTTRVVDFTDGSTIHESDLDSALLQSFYLAQEAFDAAGGTLSVLPDGSYGAFNRRISQVANPVKPDDAATKQWVESGVTSALNLANAARDTAVQAKDTAVSAKDTAVASATTATNAAATATAKAAETAADALQTADDRAAVTAMAMAVSTDRGIVVENQMTVYNDKVQAQAFRNEAETFRNQAQLYRDEAAGYAGGVPLASGVSFAPAGSIQAVNVQTAIQELDDEKASLAGASFTGALVAKAGLNSWAASASADATVNLMDDTGAARGTLFWQRSSGRIGLNTPNNWVGIPNGAADNNGLLYNGFTVYHSGNLTPSNYALASHQHAWGDITGKPTSFTPSAHGHSISDITSLGTTLDGKANLSGAAFTGIIYTQMLAANSAQNDSTAPFQIRNNSGSGDSNLAAMTFLCNNAYGLKMHLRSDGYFGIGGWSAASWRWYVNCANGDMVAAGNVSAYSDPRLKDNIRIIENALDIIDQLDGVRFVWNDRSILIGRAGVEDIGILADQVEAVLPELVTESIEDPTTGERFRTVAYDKLTPVLIQAVRELRAEVAALKAGRA